MKSFLPFLVKHVLFIFPLYAMLVAIFCSILSEVPERNSHEHKSSNNATKR